MHVKWLNVENRSAYTRDGRLYTYLCSSQVQIQFLCNYSPCYYNKYIIIFSSIIDNYKSTDPYHTYLRTHWAIKVVRHLLNVGSFYRSLSLHNGHKVVIIMYEIRSGYKAVHSKEERIGYKYRMELYGCRS